MTKTPESPDAGKRHGAQKSTSKTKASATPKRRGNDFGSEGTNKTIPVPQADALPADELQGTKSKFIPKSPYTRG